MQSSWITRRRAGLAAAVLAVTAGVAAVPGAASAQDDHFKTPKIGHVWTIILENKSSGRTAGATVRAIQE